MGTKVGPSYACSFLAYQEKLFFENYTGPLPSIYKRYIDDIFMIFQSPEGDIKVFLDAMAIWHPSLKYETQISDDSIPFLDLNISIRLNQIQTSIYYKPTDSHSYLPYDSCHPKHVLDSIPFSQFLRLKRICSENCDFLSQSTKMLNFFINRGYPSELLNNALTKVSSLSRNALLTPKNKSDTQVLPLVVGYSPQVTSVVNKTKSLFNQILSRNDTFPSKPIVAFRRAPNLQNLLVRSKLKQIPEPVSDTTKLGTFPCNRPRCKTCKCVLKLPCLKINNLNFKINSVFSCISSCLIYAITCKKCPGVIYIGQTLRMLAERFREHLFAIRNNSGTSVSDHFCHNHCDDDIVVTALVNAPSDEKARLALENKIIFFFKSNKFPGLNANFSFLSK